jgi:hypothetical protein
MDDHLVIKEYVGDYLEVVNYHSGVIGNHPGVKKLTLKS